MEESTTALQVDWLEQFMDEDDFFSEMIEPTFYTDTEQQPPLNLPRRVSRLPSPNKKSPERRVSNTKRPRPADSSSDNRGNDEPRERDPPLPSSSPSTPLVVGRRNDNEHTRHSPREDRREGRSTRLTESGRSHRRSSRSPPPPKRQALDPRRPSERTTTEKDLRGDHPSSSSGSSRVLSSKKTRSLRSPRSPVSCSRSRSRSPPRGPSAYRRMTANRRGHSADRDSLRSSTTRTPRQPLPPQSEVRTQRSHPKDRDTNANDDGHNRTSKGSPEKSLRANSQQRPTELLRNPLPPKKLASPPSSSSYPNPSREESLSPPKAPAALLRYSLHQSPQQNLSPAQVAQAAKAAAEASRFRNLQKRNQNQLDGTQSPHGTYPPRRVSPIKPASTFSRPHAMSSSGNRSRIKRPSDVTLMDDSEPPPTAPAADLRKGKQKQLAQEINRRHQSPRVSPPPRITDQPRHVPDAAEVKASSSPKVNPGRTVLSLGNRSHSSSDGLATRPKIDENDPSGQIKAEAGDGSHGEVDVEWEERKGTDGDMRKEGEDRRQDDENSLAPPSKPESTNNADRSPSIPKKSDLSENAAAPAIHSAAVTNPKKQPPPKRYVPNGNGPSCYWSGSNSTGAQNFDHFGMQRHMSSAALMNPNQMMIPNIGMGMNVLHNPAMNGLNTTMAMIAAAPNMIQFMQNANGLPGSAARMGYLNPAMDVNFGMGMVMGDSAQEYAAMGYQELDLTGMQGMAMGLPMPYELRSRMMDVGLAGMGIKDGMATAGWTGTENEGMYNERYNYFANGPDVNPGIMVMPDVASGYPNHGGHQNAWMYSTPLSSTIAGGSDVGTDFGNGVAPIPTRTFQNRPFNNRSRTFNGGTTTSTNATHHDSDARSVSSSNSTAKNNGVEETAAVGDASKTNIDTSSSAVRSTTKFKRRGGPPNGTYNNSSNDSPLIRFVGTPPPTFPFPVAFPPAAGQPPPPGYF